ncbi:hypothetical protein GSI_02623 [Ganoderma sinense ZZ0214-1]|uniref:FAD-binding domain-containing protein n=1 Tax=Ganoderma sinense ZZ0214-1 TaxID=1077348 RepID=A0A2G8SM29_9APHY|nr:hypothetical protein GSI_02623 [Ganoderma sinense ZZ0214-1]
MSSHPSTEPRIAIIGGGLGGLALLLTLHRRGIPATVYERDAAFDARAHLGGSLDLGWKSGQRALRENGLQDAFDANSRPEGEEMRIYDATGKVHFKHGGEDDPPQAKEAIRPEIDRTVLRKLLLDVVPAHLVQWGHTLSSVRSLGDGQHELTFANGLTTICDLLVGADGAHSRVRPLLSSATPEFLGVNGAEISLTPEAAKLPQLAQTIANIGKGGMMALADSHMLGVQVNGDGRIRTYAWLRAPASWALPSDPVAAKAALKEEFAGWAEGLLNLIDYCDESAIYPRALWSLPVGHKWAHVPGVTILGDAAHLMSPFAGAGANLALLDGLELGLALASLKEEGKLGEVGAPMSEVVRGFEENMCAMAGRVAAKANRTLEVCVGPGTPQAAIKRFGELAAASNGEREG